MFPVVRVSDNVKFTVYNPKFLRTLAKFMKIDPVNCFVHVCLCFLLTYKILFVGVSYDIGYCNETGSVGATFLFYILQKYGCNNKHCLCSKDIFASDFRRQGRS